MTTQSGSAMINGVQTGVVIADFTSLRGPDGEPLGQLGGLGSLGSLGNLLQGGSSFGSNIPN